MGSFKLEKGGGAIEQARGAGVLALILGLLTGLFVHTAGYILAGIGLLFLIASFGAKE